jgi:hypothetical protein
VSRLVALLLLVACRHGEGGSCDDNSDCESGLACLHDVCISQKAATKKLEQMSGIGPAPSERPIVGGDRVRVRKTTGQGRIFAACDASERLIGGGCSGGGDCASESSCTYMRSWPGQYTADDTLGARWWCEAQGPIEAYALCQGHVEADGSGSGSGLRTP